MLEYVLIENRLTAVPDDFRARVVNVESYSQSEIIDRMMEIGAGLTRSDILSMLEAQKQVLCEIVAQGKAFTTELFNVYPSMQGMYGNAADSFDPHRHRVKVNLQPGTALREAAARIHPKKATGAAGGLQIATVTDMKTGSLNREITPGRSLRIRGSRLKIAGDDAEVGVYFIDPAGQRTRVDTTDMAVNRPAELVVVVPALAAGTYQLQVVTQFSGGGRGNAAPQQTVFQKPLRVS